MNQGNDDQAVGERNVNKEPQLQQALRGVLEVQVAFALHAVVEPDSISVTADYFSLLKREEKRGNFTIYNAGPTLTTSFICFNLNKGQRDGKPLVDPVKSAWFNDLRFRQAVAHGITAHQVPRRALTAIPA